MEMTLDTCIQMLKLAQDTLRLCRKTPMSQAIVILTQAGHYYAHAADLDTLPAAEDQIVAGLLKKKDTAVQCVLVVWQNGGVDLPSYSLRQKLIDLNEANRQAWLLLPSVRSIDSTMVKE